MIARFQIVSAIWCWLIPVVLTHGLPAEYPIQPVSHTAVQISNNSFWAPRMKMVREKTIWHNFNQCEQTGRIRNFEKAGGMMEGCYEGLRFNDSDVYKVVEGAAYILAGSKDPRLDQYLDELIAKFAAAQQDDGYLYTVMTVPHEPGKPVKGVGKERWIHERESHELYVVGHLYEAAAAHYEATGKRNLLDVAIKSADLVASEFGPGKRRVPPGHQQIEIGLVRLYEVTGNRKYLEMAKFFLDVRGHAYDGRRLYGAYFQDHKPIREQDEAVGHAVRATYQYMAMADVAVLTDDQELIQVLDRLWQNVAEKKLYITGGIGGGAGEGFSAEYIMPNTRAYNETCSSIANILWNWRMFLIHGDAKYMDIVERTTYNSFLSGYGMSGDRFFYPNKLATVDGRGRSPWFPCACCPPNVVRFIPQIPSFIYSVKRDSIYASFYTDSTATVEIQENFVELVQRTNYPWDGDIKIVLNPEKSAKFTLMLRIPGWVNRPISTDLYTYIDQADDTVAVTVNGERINATPLKGYLPITRRWNEGDTVRLELPMPIRRVVANEKVKTNRGLVALTRGPMVYCAEGPDNGGWVHGIVIPGDAEFKAEHRKSLLGGVGIITGRVRQVSYTSAKWDTSVNPHELIAIPYYAWAHRGNAPMRVWLAQDQQVAWPKPTDTLAGRSKITSSEKNRWTTTAALNDQILPRNSSDHEVPDFLWQQVRQQPVGAGELEGNLQEEKIIAVTQWVQYEFPEATTISSSSVYWADRSGSRFRIPKSYQLLYRRDGRWIPLGSEKTLTAKADMMNTFTFNPVTTDALRLQASFSRNTTGGILEWSIQ